MLLASYKPKPGAEEAIYEKISDITVSMRSADYLKMPECVINEVPVFLAENEMATYRSLQNDMVIKLGDTEIDAANGKPVLVAYWYKHDLERISERLHKLHIPFSKMDTSESIVRWNRGELPIGLIHPASAGHGLNLQAGGSTIIWYGLTWSLELYQQTNARLWRQGQTAETVVIHHILAKGTIDEHIMSALQRKDKTQSALIEAVKANLKEAHK